MRRVFYYCVVSNRVQEIREESIGWVTESFENGMSAKDIADQVGVSAPTVSSWLREEGYRRKGRKRIPEAMKERAADLSERGWKSQDISKLLQIKIESLLAVISEAQANPKRKSKPKKGSAVYKGKSAPKKSH